MYIYEWEPRALRSLRDAEQAVTGKSITIPQFDSRWSEKLKPGLSSFSNVPDEQLLPEVGKHLAPLLEFAQKVLQSKSDQFSDYPIYLGATAGMRMLTHSNRTRLLNAVRTLLNDKTFCPFQFRDVQARVISGEEEAAYAWLAVNQLSGTLHLNDNRHSAKMSLDSSQTYGILELGGASTQVCFQEPDNDIMQGHFKLQLGQGPVWNLYAHSFLQYGINQASQRFEALVLGGDPSQSSRNPCLPQGATQQVDTNIRIGKDGLETWDTKESGTVGAGEPIQVLQNQAGIDFEVCRNLVRRLVHKERNQFCQFAYKGDCSFNGVYQPSLPPNKQFVGVSNFYETWDFLGLPQKATLKQLENATRYVCTLNHQQADEFGKEKVGKEYRDEMCFSSTYVLELLHYGYGFKMDDHVMTADDIEGSSVTWAFGAMLYEVNSLPWLVRHRDLRWLLAIPAVAALVTVLFSLLFFCRRTVCNRRLRSYHTVKSDV